MYVPAAIVHSTSALPSSLLWTMSQCQSEPPAMSFRTHSSCLGFPAKGRRLALFGFVFRPPQIVYYSHNSLYNRSLQSFGLSKIGFVFSNPVQISHPGLLGWGILRLALNWLCFFAGKKRINLHNILSYRHLSSFCPFRNWVCFFNLTTNFRRFLLLLLYIRDEIVLFTLIFCNPAPRGCGLNYILTH